MDEKKRMPRLLSLPEAASELKMSLRSLYSLDGLPVTTLGKKKKVVREDHLRAWLDSQTCSGDSK
ncbi:hypothetical protein N9248_01980 [bacterium]|nr:hypothetical protein [bacterium]